MGSTARDMAKAEPTADQEPQEPPAPGLQPAREGLQPVRDLATFLKALPEFGEEAERLREVMAEDRALRRGAVEGLCY